MRSTQNPHLVDFAGVVTVSHDVVPAPCISPIKTQFVDDVRTVATALNTLRPNAIEVKPFSSLGEFAQIMAELIQNTVPLTLPVANGQK